MRALDCPCGLTLTAKDADEHHADQNIPDDFIQGHVRDNARDGDVDVA